MQRTHNDVNVITADIECEQIPVAMATDASHCFVDHLSVVWPKRHWWVAELIPATLVDRPILGEQRATQLIVFGIYAPALVAMQPGTVASECDEICERISVTVNDRPVGLLRGEAFPDALVTGTAHACHDDI